MTEKITREILMSKEYKDKIKTSRKTIEKENIKETRPDKDIDKVLEAIRTITKDNRRKYEESPWTAKMADESEVRIKKLIDVAYKECREDLRYYSTGGLHCMCLKLRDPRFKTSVLKPHLAVPEKEILKFPEE